MTSAPETDRARPKIPGGRLPPAEIAGRPLFHVAGPAAAVALLAGFVWLVSGVGAVDLGLFVGYQLAFLLAPGCLLYRALGPEDGALRTLAFGWALGHVVEVLAYLATAATGTRELFVAYPLATLALAAALGGLRGLSRVEMPSRVDAAWGWAAAGASALVLLFFSLSYFPAAPLPGTVESVSYLRDVVFQLSATAEVRHHWPITDPKTAGIPVAYHTFPYMHMAAIDQVTGLGLPLVVLRLAVLPLLALFVLQLGIAGRAFCRARWAGPIAALLIVFVSEIDLDSTSTTLQGLMPFYGGGPFIGLVLSPTFVVGLVFFVPTLVLIGEWLGLVRGARWARRKWILLAIFLVGCAGSKAMILPVLLGGILVYFAWRSIGQRRLDGASLAAAGLVGSVFALFMLTLYRGAEVAETGARLGLGQSTRWTYLLLLFEQGIGPFFRAPAILLSLVAMLTAPLFGLLWFLRSGRPEFQPRHALLLSILVAGLGPFVLLRQPFGNDLFFISFGLVAASLVSAEGIQRMWSGSQAPPWSGRAVTLFAASLTLALLALWRFSHFLLALDAPESVTTAVVHLTWLGFLVAVLATLSIVWRRSRGGSRRVAVRLLLVTILGTSALNVPLDVLPQLYTRWSDGRRLHAEGDVTPAFYRGLEWIRENTSPDTVLAVNRQRAHALLPWGPGHEKAPDNFYVSALAERRVFYEGTLYSAEAFRLGVEEVEFGNKVPYPERRALNDAVFQHGDGAALRTLVRDHGVRYLVVDKRAPGSGRAYELGETGALFLTRLVFSNRDIDVYAVRL